MVCGNYCDRVFIFIFIFLNHMFIVYTVQEITCIFNDMAKTKVTLLTPGNIQTPKSLWYETNCTSRLSPNQILQTYT